MCHHLKLCTIEVAPKIVNFRNTSVYPPTHLYLQYFKNHIPISTGNTFFNRSYPQPAEDACTSAKGNSIDRALVDFGLGRNSSTVHCHLLECRYVILLHTMVFHILLYSHYSSQEQIIHDNDSEIGTKAKINPQKYETIPKTYNSELLQIFAYHTCIFYELIGVNLSLRTDERYIRSVRIYCLVAVEEPYLSAKNITDRVLWARLTSIRSIKSGERNVFGRILLFFTSNEKWTKR